MMKNKKFVTFLTTFIIVQPLFDVCIYLLNNVLNVSFPFVSLIRPLIAITIYVLLVFNKDVSDKAKKISFVYLFLYFIYCIFHVINIRNNFFSLSFGSIGNEIRYLANYGYFILQFINFYLVFKILDKEGQKKILLSIVYAILIMSILYFIAILTKTSPITYIYSQGKAGWKGWSVSAHYVGHSIIYSLPIIIYTLFEKKYIKKWYKYLILLLVIIPAFYLVGTKTPLFVTLAIIIGYTILLILDSIKQKKLRVESIFFMCLSLVLLFTFKFTFGYDNFETQLGLTEEEKTGVSFIQDNIINEDLKAKYESIDPKVATLPTFEDRMLYSLIKNYDIESAVFDNRSIQKILNKDLRSISPIKDKILGYGHDVMPICTWVETDIHTIFYCYGIIGFIMIIIIPIGFVFLNGLKCLINFKKLTISKMLFGFSYILSVFVIYYVGYTMQFAQTVFYLVILFVLANQIFNETEDNKKPKDYLFMINDLNIGGAEVGMIDVVNELVNQGNTVDVVLLRKRGPLLKKLDSKVNVFEILNKDYGKIKTKLYYILYFLGGPFTKFVYSKTIKDKYKNEIAYLEGYPAVFISASTNKDSIKIASIRVGLKNHKLKASKLPWGEYVVKKAYKKVDNIYTVSDLTTKEFIEKYPFCRNKVKTIYTYFNCEDIRTKATEKCDYKFDKKKINFLAVGRFNKQKSYDRLIEAFSRVCENHDNVLLHFVGKFDTDEGNEILSMIKEKGLSDKVILHGIQKNPYPYIKNCSCLISSSLYEGFPRVINEAICLDKLCIGTNVTGTKEALKNGKLGLLVDDSANGLVDGMNKYINNPNIYKNYKKEIALFDGNKKTYFEGLEQLTRKKKNMIIYMPKLSYGGMEKALVNLINYAKLNEKYNLTLYLIYKGEMNYIDLLPKNIKLIIACKSKWNIFGKLIAAIKLAFRFIYQIFNSYDIAISYAYQHSILTTLTRLSSKNNIVYIHGNLKEAMDEKKLKKRLRKCKYEKFNKIICVSENSKKALVELINRDYNIYVINNIIDGDEILKKSEEKITDFKFKKNKVYFINVARHYEQYKRLMRIVNATDKLNKEGYKFEVLFVGDGEDHNLYEKEIKKLNIKNIHLLGKKKNPYKYLNASSAFLLSSVREGYPVVYIESMILNKPIITTNVSDAKKDIESKYGIVVENDDKAIYDGMKQFLDSGYTIKKQFNYEKFNKDIEDLVDEVYGI